MVGFKPLPEYPEYLISADGRVYSSKTKSFLSIRVQTSGYLYFSVYYGKQINVLLHRAVCRVHGALPCLDSDLEVDHIDTDKTNCAAYNLQVLTRKEHDTKTLSDLGRSRRPSCICCGRPLANRSAKQCKDCYTVSTTSNPDITAKDIEYWVKNYSWVRASKELGLSDNGLRKRYRSLTGKDPKSIKKLS